MAAGDSLSDSTADPMKEKLFFPGFFPARGESVLPARAGGVLKVEDGQVRGARCRAEALPAAVSGSNLIPD